MSDNKTIWYVQALDNSGLKQGQAEALAIWKQMADDARSAGKNINTIWDNASKGAMGTQQKHFRESLNAHKEYVKQLELMYRGLEEELSKATPGGESQAAFQLLESAGLDLSEEKTALLEMETAFGQISEKLTALQLQMYAICEEMSRMAIQGRQNTLEFTALREELTRLADTYRGLLTEQNKMASGYTHLDGMIAGVQGLQGAYSVAQGAIGLFVSDSEKLMRVQAKLQGVMSILVGIQQASNALNETGAFRIKTVTAVTELWRIVQTKLTAALGGSTVAANVLMGVLTGGLAIAIGAVVAGISKISEKHKERKREAEEAAEKERSQNESVAQSIASMLAEYGKLQEKWKSLNGDLEAQTKFVEDNQGAFEQLGIAVEGVSDAENLFVDNEEAFVQSLLIRAQAAAAMDLAAEKYKEAIIKMQEAENYVPTKKEEKQAKKAASKEYTAGLGSDGMENGERERQWKPWKTGGKWYESYTKHLYSGQNEIIRQQKEFEDEARSFVTSSLNLSRDFDLTQFTAGFKPYERPQRPETPKPTGKPRVNADNKTVAPQQEEMEQEEAARAQAAKEEAAKTQAELDELFQKYQTYYEKRKEAAEKFQNERDLLKENNASEGQLGEVDYQMEEALAAIDSEFAMREDSFETWLNTMADASLQQLQEALAEAEELLAAGEGADSQDNAMAMYRTQIKKLKNDIKNAEAAKAAKDAKAEGKDDGEGVKKSEKNWKALRKVLGSVEKDFKAIGDAVGGTAGDIINVAGSIASTTVSIIDNIKLLTKSSIEGTESAAEGASKAVQTVEKASVILAIIGAVIQVTQKIFDFFGKDTTTEKYEEAKTTYQSYISILDKVIDKQLELAASLSGDAANAAYEKAIEMIKTQSDAARVLGQQYLNSGASRKSHSKGYDEVKDMSAAGWEDAAAALDMSVADFKALMGGRMTGLFDLTDEQLKQLSDNAHIFWSQLDSDTQNYADQIVDGVTQVGDVLEQQIVDQTGLDLESVKSDFLSLLNDMDAESKDFAGQFEEYLQNAMLNSMLKDKYANRLDAWRKKFSTAIQEGNIDEKYGSLKEEAQSIADAMSAERDMLADLYGWNSEATREASSKGIATASQDSVDELNGRMTVMQQHTFDLRENSNVLVEQSRRVAEQWQHFQLHNAQVLRHLSGIESNTNPIPGMAAQIDEIATIGVRIRQ